jgi:phosphatidylglycerophosphatase C
MTRTVAAFDFDGTLTRQDTLLPFLVSVAGPARVGSALLAALPKYRGGRDAAKAVLLERVLAGRDPDELATAGAAFGARLARRSVTPAMRERVTWHQREGHEIVIVSATLEVYLRPAAHELAIDHVIATGLEPTTGRLSTANCRGAEKARRLREFLDDDTVVWAYGNSTGDREMLALAQHPVRVRRGRIIT